MTLSTTRWGAYRQGLVLLPETMLTWPFHGAGLHNLGAHGCPISESLPVCKSDELLVRVDALGICASDAKMVRLGNEYPLFFERDFQRNPARLGHEVALTVMQVGRSWQGKYHRGQRLGLQPNVFAAGRRLIFGVNLPGGMAQFLTLGTEVLAGDDGSYVFPLPPNVSYVDGAMLEPWSCVEANYAQTRRVEPKRGGVMWIKGQIGDTTPYSLSQKLESALVILSDVPASLEACVRTHPVEVAVVNGASAPAVAAEFSEQSRVDDIVLLAPSCAQEVAKAIDALAAGGTLTLVNTQALDGPVSVDVGRLHYENLAFLGCHGPDIADAFDPRRSRSELRSGGVTLVVGASGTMGRMHIQRALEMHSGPRAVVAAGHGAARVSSLRQAFAPLAETQGREFVALDTLREPFRLRQEIDRLTDGRNCDDVVVIVSNQEAVEEAITYLAVDGLVVFFAGATSGVRVPLPLDKVALFGAQFTGASGSTVADELRILEKVVTGTLTPSAALAAVGGMRAVNDGLRAQIESIYAGKIMIFPQLPDLPLTSLPDLAHVAPEVHACLGPNQIWTAAAEQALFERYLP